MNDRLKFFTRGPLAECYKLTNDKYIFRHVDQINDDKAINELQSLQYGLVIFLTGKEIFKHFHIVPVNLNQVYIFVDLGDHIKKIKQIIPKKGKDTSNVINV